MIRMRMRILKKLMLREAVIVMPGHTTAVRGVVLQDQFVRYVFLASPDALEVIVVTE